MQHHDNAGGGGGGEIRFLKDDKDELVIDDTTVMVKSSYDKQSEHNNENTGEETTSEQSVTSERVIPHLTLALTGDPGSIEIRPENILLDHDEQKNADQFSSNLYDLCGRHICVINMLGLQTKKTPLNEGIHAFLLLLPNDLNSSHYRSGVQWLEKAFGRGALSYLFTVVTHETEETCESALKELKANTDFDEKRYHTCKRSMMDEKEIAGLLEKINIMVSENDPQSYRGLMCAGNEEQEGPLEDKSPERERKCSEFKTNEREEDKGEDKEEIKSDEGTEVQQSDNSDDSTTLEEESEIESPQLSSDKLKGCDPAAGEAGGKEVTSQSSKETCGNSEEDDTEKDTSVKCQPDSTNSEERTSDKTMSGLKENISGNMKTLVKASEETSKKMPCHKETEALFGRLHLQDKLQHKFQQAGFLQIIPPVKQHHVTCEKDLAHTFLHRLMMLDYRARYIPVKPDRPVSTQAKPVQVINSTEIDFNDLVTLLSTSADTDQTEQTHPMDVQMAVFHCSDSFLKQMMITKLSQCQYALPLLVPDPVTRKIECPLWTFRQITKTWKVTQIKDDSNIVTMKSVPVCKAETPLVSFFRLGSLSVSKSQLMNTLINDRHSTFFHRNCPGSTKSRYLMDGVAEIAWYCPAGKPNDAFNDCIAFCNLHGDALLIETQRDILIEKSSINIFLVASLKQNEKNKAFISALFKSQKPLICLCVDDSCDVKTTTGKYIMGLKDRSQSAVSEELKQIIREVLCSLDGSSLKPSFQLETMAELSGIRVDESDPACQKGKSAAMKIMDLLTNDNMDVSKIKGKFLTCQGHLWHQWSKIHKELFHLRGNIEMEKSKKQQELMNIRQKQCAASCSELVQLFIDSLSSLPQTEKEYFLKWTQILMDTLSTDDLSSICESYNKTWSEVLALKNRPDNSDLLLKQTELEEISKKLQSATFGLEHIFREMGQIYEAHRATEGESRHTDWSKYPELAAQLMISGHPVELMDGDAGHVPLTWISSLLEDVGNKLGDQRVFVLSVLGIQSSGKSTMLNTMFGLQFAVSAGRCTKGAFMQLLKVSEEMKKDFKFDYVLVVDTEGLRALELEGNTTRHHDNELATFVVGLGNLTLINIFGENPSEMQDILQIVVQAFMRMKKVKLSPSCVFVHQNVTDVAAGEKNMDGKRRLQEKLDQMAKLAAEEEVYNVECFSDVIEFDVQKDVKYCAQLWEGSPPMAPPNPGYSESIQELKDIILSKAPESAGITLSQFKTKVQDMWNALLNENFVFSFKNTLEIAVYRKLEVQYGNWTWTLRSNMLTIENQLHNRIENGNLDKVEVSHLKTESNKTYETIKKEITTYFEDDKEKEILVQWRGRFETKIKEFHEEQVSTVKKKLDEVIQQKKARKKLDDKKTEFENKLLQKSKELAQQLKDKAKDEEELEKQFSSVWRGWVTELTADTKPVEDINLEEDQIIVLQELGFEETLLNECKQSGKYKNISRFGDYSDYVKPSKFLGFLPSYNLLPHEKQEQIRALIDKAKIESLDAIRSKPVATRGYSSTYLQEVAKHVKEEVEKFQKESKYTLKKEFTVDLILHMFCRAESWLLDSQEKFKMKNDPLTYLEDKESQYYTVFRSFCKGNSSAIVLADLICEKLKASTVEAVCNKTAIGLAGMMRCNFPAFNGNRLNLEKHVLKSLAEKENFDDFITYIRNPRRQTEAFIKAEVEKYIFIDHKDETVDVLKKNVNDINTLVSQALSTATQKVKTQRGNTATHEEQSQRKHTDTWLKEFSSGLKDELKFHVISSQNFSDINDFEFLKEELKKRLESIFDQMIKDGFKESLDELKESRLKPDEILIDQLCTCCWVRCPFCAAVCTNTIEGHSSDDHSVPFHRPEGIKGWHYRGTVEFSIDFCTTNIQSDGHFYPPHDSEKSVPYKLYRTAGPEYANWRITPDESKLTYWKWFLCNFQRKLEEHYKLKFQGRGEIPSEWRRIFKEEAIKSLDDMC